MGEAINLVENFKVEKVIFNCGPYNDLEKELIKVLDKKKIKYYSCIKELNIDNNKLYFLQTKEYDNEIYSKVKDYSKERHKVITYFEIGNILNEVGGKYGDNIIEEYSKKLVIEVGKKYNRRTLFRIKKFYNVFSSEKVTTMLTQLT